MKPSERIGEIMKSYDSWTYSDHSVELVKKWCSAITDYLDEQSQNSKREQ